MLITYTNLNIVRTVTTDYKILEGTGILQAVNYLIGVPR